MSPSDGRLQFLDFARAVAALSVASMHIVAISSPAFHEATLRWFNPGVFGVLTFFLVSGFIIPFSLERLGSLRRFWINRFFRLYPLYWASLFAVLVLWKLHIGLPPTDFREGPRSYVYWNLTMVQPFARVPNAIGLYWTLAYEMLFYGLMSVLFLLKLNKKSEWIVWGGAAWYAVRAVALPLYYGGLGRFDARDFWILTFFAGTTLYRGWRGEIPQWRARLAVWTFMLCVGAGAYVSFVHFTTAGQNEGITAPAYLSGWLLAYLFFLLVLWQSDRRYSPVWLWLGKVSYSIYIVHGIFLQIPIAVPAPVRSAIYLIGTLMVAALSYRYVEEPCIRFGRSLNRVASPSPARANAA